MQHDFIYHFSKLPDPRVDRTKRYPLIEIILLIVSATLSGCEGWKQIKDFGEVKLQWLKRFLPYENGIPVDDTIARVMRKLNTKSFQTCFVKWIKSVAKQTDGDVIAIDGKTLRGSHNHREGKSAIHMVSAWSHASSLVLGQEKTANKSNEITAIPELLDVLELKGCIVTIDAMGCQTAIADKIISRGGDYVLALKGNQGDLHTQVKDFFESATEHSFHGLAHDYFEECDSGHGRIEKRCCWVVESRPKWFTTSTKWNGLTKIIMVKSQRLLATSETNDTRYYISSVSNLSAKKALATVRQHWCIENTLLWTLDVTFREDESRIRKDAAPENFAVIRHVALNLLKSDKSWDASVKRKRLRAALEDNFRETLIRQAI